MAGGAITPLDLPPTMTAKQRDDPDGEGSTDTEQQTVAEAAAVRRERQGYSLDDGSEWEIAKHALYDAGELTPTAVTASGRDNVVDWEIEADRLVSRQVAVNSTADYVSVSVDASGGGVRTGCYINLTRQKARSLGELLFNDPAKPQVFCPHEYSLSVEGSLFRWQLDRDRFEPSVLVDGGDKTTVRFDARSDDGSQELFVTLTEQEANVLGAAIYQAAEDSEVIAENLYNSE